MSTNTRSILRYPGSKARLVDFISNTIRINSTDFNIFAEPFCGGASVSIALLESNVVQEIAINDLDPLVAHLWDTVFSPTNVEWLIEQVRTIPFTIDEWKRQKNLVTDSPRLSALKCLYLNRTSFNGILHKAGPIGGWKQTKRTLDVRFNRERIANRIRELNLLSNRVVSVSCEDWQSFCDRIRREFRPIYYFDPPFYHKADSLYGYYFTEQNHQILKNYLDKLSNSWLLSYDDAPEVRKLYDSYSHRARIIDSTYSTHPIGGSSFIGRELLYSNLPRLPAAMKQTEHIGLSVRQYKKKAPHKDGVLRIPIASSVTI